MTEKRFTSDYNGDEHLFTHFLENGKPMTKEEVLNRLNDLNDKNKVLKDRRYEDINDLSVIIMKYKALEEENKELKKKVDDKEIAVEVEICKAIEKIFALINKKIREYSSLEQRERTSNDTIEILSELKKELKQ